MKSAALDAIVKNGGTVTHHHAVGGNYRPWYDRQRPPLFAEALRAARKALDPHGLLNPGVLIEPDLQCGFPGPCEGGRTPTASAFADTAMLAIVGCGQSPANGGLISRRISRAAVLSAFLAF
jgi:FAD linked oxidases, C-terminal domain